jgi:thiol-disulfide isomerase/thioredoxin
MMVPGRISRRIIASAGAVAMALLIFSCSGEEDGGKASGEDSTADIVADIRGQAGAENTFRGSVSDVTFRTLDGGEKKISDFGRKILFVNYIATWNEDSRKIVPIMNEVQRKFHANVIVLGIIIDAKSASQARIFGKTSGVKFELLLPGGAPGRFGAPAKLPTSHLVTRDNYLLTSFEGLFMAKQYEDMIKAMYRRRM